MTLYNNQQTSFKFEVKHAWLVVVLLIVAQVAASIPVAFAGVLNKMLFSSSEQVEAWLNVATMLLTYAILLFLIYLVFKNKVRPKPLIEQRKLKWYILPILLLTTLSFIVVFEPVNIFFEEVLPMPEFFKKIFEKAFTPSIATVFTAVIIAPLFEELLMRGIILRGLLTSGSTLKAILWSAFLFAFIHLNPWQALPAFTIGIFLGWVYYKTRSIWTPIFIHFVNNGVSFIALYFATQKGLGINATVKDLITTDIYTCLYVASAIVLPLSILALYFSFKNSKSSKSIQE